MVSASGTLVRGSGRSLLFLVAGMLALGLGIGASLGIASVLANNHDEGTTYYACVDPRSGTISHLQADTPPNCPFGRQLIALSGADATAALSDRLAALETLLACVQHEPGANPEIDDIVFEGCNVHVRNGAGETATTNELGNLIVGYSEERPGGDDRGGSHNLVVGPEHTYSSYGGFVAGFRNSVANENASVSGGRSNQASGPWSSVSGGERNVASGWYSSISGGDLGQATDSWSSVAGGFASKATSDWSFAAGGQGNEASGSWTTAVGGVDNEATVNSASVFGGAFNIASGDSSTVTGGLENIASGSTSSVSGGQGNTASGDRSSVSGGLNREASNEHNWAAGNLSENN